MAEYRLYGFAQSGNAYKVALMLQLAGADWEPVFVDFFNGATRTPVYRAEINLMGEAPVLVHGAQRLTQSGAILHYLADQLGRFGPRAADDRYEILRWILFDNHKFTSYLATYRFLNAFTTSPSPEVMQFLKGRFTSAMSVLEAHLGDRAFVVGEAPSIADLSLCGYLFYPAEEFGFDPLADCPAMTRWLAALRALPGWAHPYTLLPGHPIPAR